MSDYPPEPDDLSDHELLDDGDEDETEAEDLEVEDVEPLADHEMTDAQPEQPGAQDDASFGDTPEVEEDDG